MVHHASREAVPPKISACDAHVLRSAREVPSTQAAPDVVSESAPSAAPKVKSSQVSSAVLTGGSLAVVHSACAAVAARGGGVAAAASQPGGDDEPDMEEIARRLRKLDLSVPQESEAEVIGILHGLFRESGRGSLDDDASLAVAAREAMADVQRFATAARTVSEQRVASAGSQACLTMSDAVVQHAAREAVPPEGTSRSRRPSRRC